jgi:hypothetical protein
MRMRRRTLVLVAGLAALVAFLGWRFVRPLNIFDVSEKFERPVDTSRVWPDLRGLSADDCGECHGEFLAEWRTSIHSRAWTEPYFQADWNFDGRQQICKNCHIPLDVQQEHRVLGFRDESKWDPILAPNPEFDQSLQHEGVTCAACHLRDGMIVGVFGDGKAPHPVRRIGSGNEVCLRCHIVEGDRWDTFFRFPPCGTVAEIQAGRGERRGRSGETTVADVGSLGCVECHMPLVQRALVSGGKVRPARRHLWRGGHDPEMVRRALDLRLERRASEEAGAGEFVLTLVNVGAAHYVPTGTPDRHLVLSVRLLDAQGTAVSERRWVIERTVMWRPFIVDLNDNRLPPNEPRAYEFTLSAADMKHARAIVATLRYGLVGEKRRRRIGYQNQEPISYEVFRRRIELSEREESAPDVAILRRAPDAGM